MTRSSRLIPLVVLIATLGASDAFANAKLIITVLDGFSDPKPVTPVGGNSGTTLGQQRTNAANRAAEIWGQQIESSVDILVNVSFQQLECSASGAVLGSAGPASTLADFPNAPKARIFYPIALANKLAGRDLAPNSPDITARFNARIDDADCLGASNWYYGFDGNNGEDSDFLVVFLHELAHGLGFSSGVNPDTGVFRSNLPGIYDTNILDNSTGLRWDQMTSAQRFASVSNDQNVVWMGESSRGGAARKLGATPVLRVNEPASIAKTYSIGSATFGATATVAGLTANIAAAIDGPETPAEDDPAGTDYTLNGCGAFTNPSAVAGRFALVNRGQCTFVQKAINAQAAGAIGLIIADNVVRLSPPGMSGTNSSILIPVYSLTRPDGQGIRDSLASGVGATLFADSTRLAGADIVGFVKLYLPSEIQPGSSVSHWDVSASPNLLMEPNINDDLLPEVDITVNLMLDIGWTRAVGNPVQPPPPTPPTTGRRSLRRGN